MRCHEIMKRRVQCAVAGASVADVARQMEEHDLGFLPVRTAAGEVVGVVTDRDLALGVCARGLGADTRVEEVMARLIVACKPDDPVAHAEQLMSRYGVHRVLILDRERHLAGVVSLTDVAQCEEPLRLARLVRDIASHEYRVESSHG